MKYKTLFRLMLQTLGVFFVVQGLARIAPTVTGMINRAIEGKDLGLLPRLWSYIGYLVTIALGLYLFFGGKWIVNKAIRSNRPYCIECGYELRSITSNRCPECGTEILITQRDNEATETALEE